MRRWIILIDDGDDHEYEIRVFANRVYWLADKLNMWERAATVCIDGAEIDFNHLAVLGVREEK